MLAHSSYNPAEVRPNHVLHYRWSSPGGLPLRSGFTVGFCVPCCSSFSPSSSRLECSWICLCLSSAGASAKVAPHFSHVYFPSLSGLLILFPQTRILLNKLYLMIVSSVFVFAIMMRPSRPCATITQ